MLALLCIASSFPSPFNLEQYFLFFFLPYNCCFLSTFHMNQFCITASTIVFKRRDEDSHELYLANYIRVEINTAKPSASSTVQGVTWLPGFMTGQIKSKKKKALKYLWIVFELDSTEEIILLWKTQKQVLEDIFRKAKVHSHHQKFFRDIDSNHSPETHFNRRHIFFCCFFVSNPWKPKLYFVY